MHFGLFYKNNIFNLIARQNKSNFEIKFYTHKFSALLFCFFYFCLFYLLCFAFLFFAFLSIKSHTIRMPFVCHRITVAYHTYTFRIQLAITSHTLELNQFILISSFFYSTFLFSYFIFLFSYSTFLFSYSTPILLLFYSNQIFLNNPFKSINIKIPLPIPQCCEILILHFYFLIFYFCIKFLYIFRYF